MNIGGEVHNIFGGTKRTNIVGGYKVLNEIPKF
jgi:hypothetical protein